MRYAIVSDIHANLQAWRATLTDIGSNRVDGILSLGDVLGYGPNPAKVLESVHQHVHAFAMGNHDAVLCNKLDPVRFHADARAAIDWTRSALAPRALEFLSAMPLVLVGNGFRCAHGDFGRPGAFRYVLDPADALPSWQATSEPILFVGHTHIPGIHVIGSSGIPHLLPPQDFALEPGKRYLVNVGSVGFPRDDDPRACYCIYDTATREVFWRRIPFDIGAYRAALLTAGLPTEGLSFLNQDPLVSRPQIREQLAFVPATQPAEQAQDVQQEQELARTLRRKLTRLRLFAGLLLLLALGALTAAVLVRASARPAPARVCPAADLPARPARLYAQPGANLLPPIPAATDEGGTLPGWRYFLDDATRQIATIEARGDPPSPRIRVTSLLRNGRVRIESQPIDLGSAKIRRLCMVGRLNRSPDCIGSLSMVLDLVCADRNGNAIQHPRRELKDFRQQTDGSWVARKSFDLLRNPRFATVAFEGSFTGAVEVAELSLTVLPMQTDAAEP